MIPDESKYSLCSFRDTSLKKHIFHLGELIPTPKNHRLCDFPFPVQKLMDSRVGSGKVTSLKLSKGKEPVCTMAGCLKERA